MSVKAISWAFEAQVGNSNAKLVLLALADHANEQHECWPGAELVATKAEIHRATVFRAVNYLIKHRFIIKETRTHTSGVKRTPKYLLNVEPQNQSLVANSDNPSRIAMRQPSRTAATIEEPSIEPSVEEER